MGVLIIGGLAAIVLVVIGALSEANLIDDFIGVPVMIFSILIVIFVIVFSAVVPMAMSDECDSLREEYAELTLLKEIAEESDNEYLRFMCYEQVSNYNEQYERMVKHTKSEWIGLYINDEWLTGLAPIDFTLKE